MYFRSKKHAPWLAISSLIFSSFLTLTHNHGGACDCSAATNQHSFASVICGLKGMLNVPLGACGGCDCGTSSHPDSPMHRHNEHDKDSCSICRMVYEHATEDVEFTFVELDEPVFDLVVFIFSTHDTTVRSSYLTRGPPAICA